MSVTNKHHALLLLFPSPLLPHPPSSPTPLRTSASIAGTFPFPLLPSPFPPPSPFPSQQPESQQLTGPFETSARVPCILLIFHQPAAFVEQLQSPNGGFHALLRRVAALHPDCSLQVGEENRRGERGDDEGS